MIRNGQSSGWALILGASSGMGSACCRLLSREGFNIAGVHLDPAERQPAIDTLLAGTAATGAKVCFFNENAASDPARAKVIGEMREAFQEAGGVRLLVHSLAFGTLLPFIRHTPGEEVLSRRQMDMTLSVMANSLVYWVQDLFEQELLKPGARIFALTSAGSTKVTRNYGAVSAAKCALESHVRQLALELAPYGIAVNAIRAGVTITPSLLRIPEHEAIVNHARQSNPHRRLTEPDDVAQAIAILAGAQSSWITGNVIGVDGGEMLTS